MGMNLGESLKKLPGPILITGHTGFKGTWATLLMEKIGLEVVGFSLEPEQNSLYTKLNRKNKIPEIFSDIRNFESVNKAVNSFKPSAIFHFAAEPLVLKSYLSPRLTFETNIQGTANLVDSAFKVDSTKLIIVVTSDKVYKNDNTGKNFKETDELFGKDPYSASKVGAELIVSAWQNIWTLSGGPKIISVRAGNVIGGGDNAENRLMPELIDSFNNSKKIKIKNPQSTRPWQHVLDPLIGYIMASEKLITSEHLDNYNFGPKEPSLSVDEVVKLSKIFWGSDLEIVYEPTKIILESTKLSLNSEKAQKNLNWYPLWKQEEAVRLTIEWWKKVLVKNNNPFECTLNDIQAALRIMEKRS